MSMVEMAMRKCVFGPPSWSHKRLLTTSVHRRMFCVTVSCLVVEGYGKGYVGLCGN